MTRISRSIALAFCLSAFAVAASAQTVSVGTGASETATYGTTSQSAGPFPWTDFGLTASASVDPGVLTVNTGGSTSFTLDSTVSGGESFVPGTTVLNLGYTPNWTGSFSSAPPAQGNFGSSFVYNIGPFSGSDPILNVNLNVPGSETGALTSSLNAPVVSPPVIASQNVSGPGVSAGVGVQAQACFIVCVTVASASINFNVGTQIQQTVVAAPVVTYGDLVWESTSQTYSASDHPVFVAGALGNIANIFTAPTGLGLTTGETFYYNFLPVVEVDMPVINDSQVSLPASVTASYDIFGVSGSDNIPLGDLYSLNTGAETFDFNPDFYSSEFYSIALDYTAPFCPPNGIACFGASYVTPSSGGPSVNTPGGGVPGDSGPGSCVDVLDCNVTVPGNPGTGTTTFPNLGPLFPPAGSNGMVCGPVGTTYAGQCINQVVPSPEPDGMLLLGIGLFGLAALVTRRKLRSQQAPGVI